MYKIRIMGQEAMLRARPGQTLKDVLEENDMALEGACGGKGTCGTCKVYILDPPDVPLTPHKHIRPEQARQGMRLACRIQVHQDMLIRLPLKTRFAKKKNTILDQVETHPGPASMAPAALISEKGGQFFLKYDRLPPVPLDNWSEQQVPRGIAIDLGTTTLVVALVDLHNDQRLIASKDKPLWTASDFNPQAKFGHDVLSRIQHASSPEGREELTTAIREKINELLYQVCRKAKSSNTEIVDLVIGGNTTMLELAAGLDPSPLGHIPFRVDLKGGQSYQVQDFGLHAHHQARIYIPPVVHAFVGTDITAGLLLCPDFFSDSQNILYLDMGTNGEICLNAQGRRFATSTAAGPAFEGMGLSCGTRAIDGALEKVIFRDGELEFKTIGDRPLTGICGSGCIDLIAALLKAGLIDTSGRLHSPEQDAFFLNTQVWLSQKDIRQMQLAKGAVRTGIDLLLIHAGLKAEDMDTVYLAGGFGNYLDPHSMETIGLLPPGCADKVKSCGNASLNGALILLQQSTARTFLEEQCASIEHVQLASDQNFMKNFVQNLRFPAPDAHKSSKANE